MHHSSVLHGVILKKQSYKDSDLLITVFSLEEGKITLYAKGVQKSSSKFRGFLELGAVLRFEVIASRDIPLIQGIKSVFLPESLSYEDLLMFEAVLSSTKEHCKQFQKIEPVFHFLAQFISSFQEFSYPVLRLSFFELRLLSLLGFVGDLRNCQSCGQKFEASSQFFIEKIGCVCLDCSPSFLQEQYPVSFDLIKVLAFFQQADFLHTKQLVLSQDQERQLKYILPALVEVFHQNTSGK